MTGPREDEIAVSDYLHLSGTLSLSERLRAFRHRHGLTQHELAARSGMSVRALRDIEHGRVRRPHSHTVRNLASLLGLDAEEVRRLLAAGTEGASSADEVLRIGVLGTLSIRHGDLSKDIRAPKLRRLLALLALRYPEPAGLEEITRTLWPKRPPRSYQNLIHTYVSQARMILLPPGSGSTSAAASSLSRTPGGYVLSVDRDQVDLTCFQDLSSRARQAHSAGATAAAYELAARAYRCWRGPLLADEPLLSQHSAAIAAARQRLEILMLSADLAMELRQSAQVVLALRAAAEEEPLHEGLQARLMLALASCGEQSEALEVFAELTRRLDAELGIGPGEELRRAQLRVLQQELPGPRPKQPTQPAGAGERAEPSARLTSVILSPMPRPSQMPAEPVDQVSRVAETRRLDQLLLPDGEGAGQVPGVLVTGLPGVGKTALALRWAHRVRDRFPDGELYVDLHGYDTRRPLDPREALASFLRALDVPDSQIPDTLDEAANLYRTQLSGRRVLIVLDNAREEHQIRPLIPGAAGCAVLITSRSTLTGLVAREGMRRIGLDALDRTATYELLAKLLGRRRVDAEPLAAMALGRYCGGLPLAIRIVAARLADQPRLGIARYCAELQDTGLFPGGEGDDLFQSIQAAFEPSYTSLPEATRCFFRLLGAADERHITPYTAAELTKTTTREAMRMLRRLADASLLQEYAHGRFTLPEPMLRYARALAERHDSQSLQAI
ncbi:BTAD domain-containing putative transcriptional regulator [Streptomyces canus]|uniref:BTAD domain-containing putative transcriptional regulator n=1 Tax=Streptomyces canus TaxID=58343 RepID=UPI0033B41422